MKRYKKIFEGFKDNLMDQAEDFLNNGQVHSAVRYIAKSMNMNFIPSKYDDLISKQEHSFVKDGNNINNFTFISNITKILKGKSEEDLVKLKTDRKPRQNNKAIDNAVQRALAGQNQISSNEVSSTEVDENIKPEEEKEEVKEDMKRYKKLFMLNEGRACKSYVNDSKECNTGCSKIDVKKDGQCPFEISKQDTCPCFK